MSEKIPPIGTLRERVQLLNKVISADNSGGHEIDFVSFATVWAQVTPSKGRAYFEANSRSVIATHVVLLRFRDDLSVGDRIIYRNEELEVLSVDDLNARRAYLRCVCTKKSVIG